MRSKISILALLGLLLSSAGIAGAQDVSDGPKSAQELLGDPTLEVVREGPANQFLAANGEVQAAYDIVDPNALRAIEEFQRMCRSCKISQLYVVTYISYSCGCYAATVSWRNPNFVFGSDRTSGFKTITIPRGDYVFSAYARLSGIGWRWVFYNSTELAKARVRAHYIEVSWYLL